MGTPSFLQLSEGGFFFIHSAEMILNLFILCRTKFYIDGALAVNNDGVHMANTRICRPINLTSGSHQIYVTGFEGAVNSELEITYSGPDTFGVRTMIGGQPFYPACDPRTQLNPATASSGFVFCAYTSDPISPFDGDCEPTVGIAHPRYSGPCLKAIGTVSKFYDYFAGGFYVPVLGAANGQWVSKCRKKLEY